MLKKFYIGIKGVIVLNSKVLLMKKLDQEGKVFWDIPGGRMNENEEILDALVREMKEEVPSIGKFEVGKLLSAYKLDRDLKDGYGLMLLFYSIKTDSLDVQISDEHIGYQWFSLEDLDDVDSSEAYMPEGYLEVARKAVN